MRNSMKSLESTEKGMISTAMISTLDIFPPRYFSTITFPPLRNCDAIIELPNEANTEFYIAI